MTKFVTVDITIPNSGDIVYKNRWWLCDGDATKAIFGAKQMTPQCNSDEKVIQWSLKQDMYKDAFSNLKAIYVETAFVPLHD